MFRAKRFGWVLAEGFGVKRLKILAQKMLAFYGKRCYTVYDNMIR